MARRTAATTAARRAEDTYRFLGRLNFCRVSGDPERPLRSGSRCLKTGRLPLVPGAPGLSEIDSARKC
eukprot:270213-Pyramimonas_sp.AAC.1